MISRVKQHAAEFLSVCASNPHASLDEVADVALFEVGECSLAGERLARQSLDRFRDPVIAWRALRRARLRR